MSLIKKIDVPRHMAARRAQRHLADHPVIKPNAATIAEVSPAGTNGDEANFREDFSAEHSSAPSIRPAKH